MPISSKIKPDSIVYTDAWRSYNALDVSQFYHKRINHSTEFAKGKNHINGIENFWSQAKRVLRRYNGIHKGSFPLFNLLKSASFVLTTAHLASSLKSYGIGVKFEL